MAADYVARETAMHEAVEHGQAAARKVRTTRQEKIMRGAREAIEGVRNSR